ncbi:SpoIIE family protein phosphatase [Micromonospora endolithica]|uniref:SpoIIE family protein phosphatase n=1 Tax=Micromonospora endolithica TaxID=230091 RepID=UPI0011ABAD56|nr:SpoIIE family protein phosphatase [Micromonospora endolithica]TWJ20542.1 PAS domain S-box-containing protein [Micromonospora endolithica]
MTDSPSPATPADDVWPGLLAAGGETGARIAARDWSGTPLGPLSRWPQSLRTAVTLCLHSPAPMLLWWGAQRVVLHNDAYRPLLDGADVLGRPGAQAWPQRWDVLGPLLDGVLAGRPATWTPEQPAGPGAPVTLAYGPVVDESGRPGGVLTTVVPGDRTDRTGGSRVVAPGERAVGRAAQAELRLFQALVERSGDFIAVATPDGRAVYLNPAGRELIGLADGASVADLRLVDGDSPRVRDVWRQELIPAALRDGQHRAESRLVRLDTGARFDVDHQTFTVSTGDGPDSTAFVATVARDVSDRKRALRQAEALSRLAGGLSTARDRTAIVAAVLRTVPAVFDGATVRMATAAPGGPALRVCAGTDTTDLDLAADLPLARAVRENRVVRDGTAVCVPLRYGDGAAFGALEVRRTEPVADSDHPQSLLDAVAGLCGQALQRAELVDSTQAMADFAARLSVTRSTAEAIEVILTAAPIAVGAVLPGLAMREEGRRVRLWYAGVPSSLSATFRDLTIDDPRPIATALRTGERIVLTDRAEFARRFPGLPDPVGAHGLVTTVALPLLDARRRPIAALGFGWRRERPLRAGDLALLDTVADLCEQTLERVRLAAAEHNLVTRLAGRLRTSNRTTPAGLRVATRYTPAMSGLHLGGDWHDLVDLDGDGLAVVVGDVVGHRVEAAADMAQLRTMINTLIRLGVPLGEVFPRLTDLLGVGFLGTCLAMTVDPVAGRVRVARVGHPHPVLVRPGQPPRRVDTASALPLGLVREAVPVTTLPFGPGDLLVAYTDGLVERRNRAYDEGVAALHAVVDAYRDAPVEAIADAVMAELAGSEDDQALVVIRHVG